MPLIRDSEHLLPEPLDIKDLKKKKKKKKHLPISDATSHATGKAEGKPGEFPYRDKSNNGK